jgi:beta-lactamase regulating signal transducer with metallopeptidase domain
MTASAWFSGSFFTALGWALFHFLWQGALVAAVLAAVGAFLARRSPAVRYAVACGALATMLALPIATAWSLTARGTRHSAVAAASSDVSGSILGVASPVSPDVAGDLLPESLRGRFEALRPWVLLAWFAGVLVLSIRFLGGLRTANRLTRRGTRPATEEYQRMLARLAARLTLTRPVKLLQSAVVKVPTAIGAFRPAILLPASVFTGLPTRGLEALIAHELAHVRRHDYLVNLIQTAAETLLFYHPAVWWVSSRIRAEREQCCDDLAIAATGDARSYARALVRLEEMRGSAPALAVAAGGGNLWKRVLRLLSEPPSSPPASGWLSGALALATVFVIGAAARVGSPESWEDPGSAAALTESIGSPDAVVRAPRTSSSRAAAATADRKRSTETPAPSPEILDIAQAALSGEEEPADEKTPEPAKARRTLTEDELHAFEVHGVTPEFIQAVRALGYDRADPDDLVALRIHGVTPEAIAEMNRIFGKQPLEEHVSFKIHGVDPDAVRRMSALGLGKISPDDAVSLKIHGVDTAYVEALKSAGYEAISADDAISARIHGVAPEDATAWVRLGYPHPSLEDLVAVRIHGVSPEFAQEIRSAGVKADSLEDLTSFRIHGVTAEYVRELKSLGLSELNGEDAVSFRIHGVTPELVRGVRALGYSNPSPDDLVALRIHGISVEEIRKTNARAGRRVALDDVVERHLCGQEGDDHE